jgi:hypothetical protein
MINPLLKEEEHFLTPHRAGQSSALYAQFGEHSDEEHFFDEYTKARANGMPYAELLELIKNAAIRLTDLTGKQVSYRSLITKMSKKGIYGTKATVNEEQGIESKGRKVTDDAADYPQLVHRCSDLLESWSKDRLLIELEYRLQLHPGALFSLRCGNRLAIISLILGIKDVANELIDPDIESLFDSKPEKEAQRQVK